MKRLWKMIHFFNHQGVNDAKMIFFLCHSCFELSTEKLKKLEERNLIAHNTFAQKMHKREFLKHLH